NHQRGSAGIAEGVHANGTQFKTGIDNPAAGSSGGSDTHHSGHPSTADRVRRTPSARCLDKAHHAVDPRTNGCRRLIMSTANHAPKTTSDAKQNPGHHCGTPGLSMKK